MRVDLLGRLPTLDVMHQGGLSYSGFRVQPKTLIQASKRKDQLLVFLRTGRLKWEQRLKTQWVEAPALINLPVDAPGFLESDGAAKLHWCRFLGTSFTALSDHLREHLGEISPLPKNHKSISQVFERMPSHYFKNNPTTRLNRWDVQLLEVLVTIEENLMPTDDSQSTNWSPEGLHDYLYHHIHEACDLEAASKYFEVSRSTLQRYSRSWFGMSYQRKLQAMKISRAESLLQHTSKSIQEISNLVGFDQAHYFSMVFKRQLGVSPRDYRTQP